MHGSKSVKFFLYQAVEEHRRHEVKAPRILGFDIRSWFTVAPSCGHFDTLGQCLLSYFLNYINILDAVVKRKIAAFPSTSEYKLSRPLAVGDGDDHVNTNSTVFCIRTPTDARSCGYI
jgi:hypothetical protein